MVRAVQMQPHFIFNTLSAIRTLCRTDPALAEESIDNLAGYLRGSIDAFSSEELIPFDDEFRHIRQYIDLEQADPAKKFHFEYELDVRDFRVPALTVQPIVENAVKHGALTRKDGRGRVQLSTEEVGGFIRITILDNGYGYKELTEKENKSKGIGIENTKERLETLCRGSLSISSDGAGKKRSFLSLKWRPDKCIH